MDFSTKLNREEAIAFGQSQQYKNWSAREKAEFQLRQEFLCIPFDMYHEALEEVLGRPVMSHELAQPWSLLRELRR